MSGYLSWDLAFAAAGIGDLVNPGDESEDTRLGARSAGRSGWTIRRVASGCGYPETIEVRCA